MQPAATMGTHTRNGQRETDEEDRMDSAAAGRLAARLKEHKESLSLRLAVRLLKHFPEIEEMLKLEGEAAPPQRLVSSSSGRLCELVRAILIFEDLSLADKEFGWAAGVLPRSGVSYDHQTTMVRWFFEEARQLGIDAVEEATARDVEQHILSVLSELYPRI
jgi:hypothetical protein